MRMKINSKREHKRGSVMGNEIQLVRHNRKSQIGILCSTLFSVQYNLIINLFYLLLFQWLGYRKFPINPISTPLDSK